MIKFKFEPYRLGGTLTIIKVKGKLCLRIGDIGWRVGNKFDDEIYPIGYSIAKEYEGKGIMTFALSLFIKKCKAKHLEACVLPNNIASKRVLLKNGFVEKGLSPDGRFVVFELKKGA